MKKISTPIWKAIFLLLSPQDEKNFACVCKGWKRIAENSELENLKKLLASKLEEFPQAQALKIKFIKSLNSHILMGGTCGKLWSYNPSDKGMIKWKKIKGIVSDLIPLDAGGTAVCTENGNVHILDSAHEVKTTFHMDQGRSSITHLNNHLICANAHGTLCKWDLKTHAKTAFEHSINSILKPLFWHKSAIHVDVNAKIHISDLFSPSSICYSMECKSASAIALMHDTLLMASMEPLETRGKIFLWDLKEKKIEKIIEAHPKNKIDAILIKQFPFLQLGITGTCGEIKFWDIQDNWKCIQRISLDNQDSIESIALSRKGLLVSFSNGSVKKIGF